jgi:hypothetical protein
VLRFNPIAKIKQVLGIQDRPPTGPGDEENLLVTMGEQNLAWTYYQEKMKLATDRVQRYQEFEKMDDDDVPASVVDLYAEDACQPNPHEGRALWVYSRNPQIQELADRLLEAVETEESLFGIARGVALYGDDFNAILQERREDGTRGGVAGLENIDPKTIWRHKDKYGQLKGFSRGPQPNDERVSMPYEYLHFRLLGRSRRTDYGYSVLAPARRVYRKLMLMEDALCIYRLRRVPDRFVFKFKLGDIPLPQKMKLLNQYRQQIKKKMLTDPATGQIRSEMDPLSIDEDVFLDESTASVERLGGMSQVNPVLDIDYMRKRFFGAVRVPSDYLGFQEAKGASLQAQSPLSAMDIQFARTVKKIQKAVISGFVRLIQIDLCWRGIDPMLEENEFKVHMEPVSYLDEMYRANVSKIRAETVVMLKDLGANLKIPEDKWLRYVSKISGFPEELFAGESRGLEAPTRGRVDLLSSEERDRVAKRLEETGSKDILEAVVQDPKFLPIFRDDFFTAEQSSLETMRRSFGVLPEVARGGEN